MVSPLASVVSFGWPPAEPQTVETLLSDAIAHLNAGRKAEALATIAGVSRSVEVGPLASTLLGLIAMSAGAHDIALQWIDTALAIDPNFVEALKSRATTLADCGRSAEADEAFRRAFRAGCVDPVAYYHHGNVLGALGRRDEAIAAYDTALRLRPDYPEALRAGGGILRDGGYPEQALRFFDQALRLRPRYFEAIVERANLLESQDWQEAALEALDSGLLVFPGNAQLLNNRGVVLTRMGRMQEACASCDSALAADPTLVQAYLNRGHAEVRQGLFPKALHSFETAVALRPDYVEALSARGLVLKMLERFAEAFESFEAALRVDPTSVYALTNRGELKLLLGDFEGGWPDYDARWKTRGHEKPVLGGPVPEWTGQTSPGRVAIFADQAAGDVINFARYVPILRASGAEVTFICRPRLQRLLRGVSAGVRVVAAADMHEPFDYQIPLSGMPCVCRTNERNMPTAPYIEAEADLAARWKTALGYDGFKIGLCWRGSQDWRSDARRSVPLDALRPLAAIPGVRLVSLQMSDNIGPDSDLFAAMRIETLGPDLDSGADGFVETAAVMANLDLVISCDTSIAHLAGALGRPTFVLLQKVPEWRFMVGREDSPWYPSMRLFRQIRQDDWTQPVEALVAAAAARASAKAYQGFGIPGGAEADDSSPLS